MRKAHFGKGVGRGVWIAPWMGPDGELILVAVTRADRCVGQRVLKFGDDHVRASDELWEIIEREDHMPALQII